MNKVLNCNLEYYNPADHYWGWVNEDGSTGSYKELAEDDVDIIIGCQYVVEKRLLVSLLFPSFVSKLFFNLRVLCQKKFLRSKHQNNTFVYQY